MTDNELVQRLIWASLLAALGFAVSFVAEKGAEFAWRRIMGGEPPKN